MKKLSAILALVLLLAFSFVSCMQENPDKDGTNIEDGGNGEDEKNETGSNPENGDKTENGGSDNGGTTPDDNKPEGGDNTNPDEPAEPEDPDVHIHKFGEWVVTTAPTCTENGEKERACSCTLHCNGYLCCRFPYHLLLIYSGARA